MRVSVVRRSLFVLSLLAVAAGAPHAASAQQPPPPAAAAPAPARPAPGPADILRGAYGPYRANNDLLSYELRVRVDPEKKSIAGRNTIRFRMLEDGRRIQLDLTTALRVDGIRLGTTALQYERQHNAVFVDFPEVLRKGRVYAVEFDYSGEPAQGGRFGGLAFRTDPAGRPWINTACQGIGASTWWPNKDQQRDEVEWMRLHVEVPKPLVDVSNGRFLGSRDLGDGFTRYDWLIQYPINNYSVSLNIGHYVHFTDRAGRLPLDFYCLPENLEKAKRQFVQAKTMIECFEKYFGDYPFAKDGYKLVEVPYAGMEHQSAVTYGNHFVNGYLERDWTGVGISPRFDFIIIHESAHEWFGNSVTAADVCDEWIHEGWGTYLEAVYVEHMFGKADALTYVNAYKTKVRHREPVITECGVNRTPSQDMYFKGALFINTLRGVVNDDARWWKLLRAFYHTFKYRNIATSDVERFFSERTGLRLGPVFDQYLRHTGLPTLELRFDQAAGQVAYRWKADVQGFAMPVKVGKRGAWQVVTPTAEWQTLPTSLPEGEFDVATDEYYVNVSRH